LATVARAVLHAGPNGTVVLQAAGGLFLFAAIGYIIGAIAERTVEESVRGRLAAELAAREASKGK
jgi:hypothetical protein